MNHINIIVMHVDKGLEGKENLQESYSNRNSPVAANILLFDVLQFILIVFV